MNESNQYEMGRQAGALEAHNDRLKVIEEKVDVLIQHMEQTKGGFEILMKVGAASTVIGAGLATVAQWLWGRTPHG